MLRGHDPRWNSLNVHAIRLRQCFLLKRICRDDICNVSFIDALVKIRYCIPTCGYDYLAGPRSLPPPFSACCIMAATSFFNFPSDACWMYTM